MSAGRALAAAAGLVLACAASPARAADWQPVPGAPELQVDLASMESRGRTVSLWVRGLRVATMASIVAPLPIDSKWHRTLARVRLDCRSRDVQVEGVLGYDAAGRLVHASGVPSARRALQGDGELMPLFDAACELARTQA